MGHQLKKVLVPYGICSLSLRDTDLDLGVTFLLWRLGQREIFPHHKKNKPSMAAVTQIRWR